MITSRTPVRISFFGGGTDYPVFFQEEPGAALSMAIDKYTYVSCRYLPPFFPDFVYRIVYSQIELVNEIDQIQHPSVRECLRLLNISHGVNVQHEGDVPARTGVGSSSSFTVGLLNALYALLGRHTSKMQLALDAIYVEQDMIREHVGVQDQLAAAFGGFNLLEFEPGGTHRVIPVILPAARLADFLDHLVLVFTGFQRYASEIAAAQVAATPHKRAELRAMRDLVYAGWQVLHGSGDLGEFGRLLDTGWHLKRGLTDSVSTPAIDYLYDEARHAGAIGGKLLGAGGGGFALFFVPPERRERVRSHLLGLPLDNVVDVPFGLDRVGSEIITYQPEEPEVYATLRNDRIERRASAGVGRLPVTLNMLDRRMVVAASAVLSSQRDVPDWPVSEVSA